MTENQKNRFNLTAYHKKREKEYPVVSLGVFGMARKHTLLDIYNSKANKGEAPLLVVNDCDVEIIEPEENNINHSIKTMLRWRGIEKIEDACTSCDGSGVKTYANTTTWRGGIGGQALTSDICDTCWGSGNKNRSWANMRELLANTKKAERLSSELAKMQNQKKENSNDI